MTAKIIRDMGRMIALVTLVGVLMTAERSAADLDSFLRQYPAQNSASQASLSAALLAQGPAAIEAVCARLVSSDGSRDLAERYALSGLAKHVTRPGAEAERRVFSATLVSVLEQGGPAEVRAFLLELLMLAGGDEAVSSVAHLLRDTAVAAHAAQTLQAIGSPGALAALRGGGAVETPAAAPAASSYGEALAALARQDTRRALDACLEGAQSADPARRAAALAVAETLDHRQVSRRFSRLMRNAPGPVQADIWRMLVRRGEGRLPRIGHVVDADGFHPIFNGANLDGWTGDTRGYRARNGVITWQNDGKNLYTEASYGDFALRFEFRLEPGANNGLGVRVPMEGQASYDGVELQILDDTAEKYNALEPWQYHGSVYGVVAAERGHLRPVGEWNEQEVIVQGSHYKVILNGHTIVDADVVEAAKDGTADGKEHLGIYRSEGHLALLGHGSVVEFRNLWVKRLD